MQRNEQLKKAIFDAGYRSESAMANSLGWPRQRLNKITNGIKEPDLQELDAISQALHRPIGEVARFFLPNESPNG